MISLSPLVEFVRNLGKRVSPVLNGGREASRSITPEMLSGRWYALWQSTTPGEKALENETVTMEQSEGALIISNIIGAAGDGERPGIWTAKCRVDPNGYVYGLFRAVDAPVHASGALSLSTTDHGETLTGNWLTGDCERGVREGFVVIARNKKSAIRAMSQIHSLARRFQNLMNGADAE